MCLHFVLEHTTVNCFSNSKKVEEKGNLLHEWENDSFSKL